MLLSRQGPEICTCLSDFYHPPPLSLSLLLFQKKGPLLCSHSGSNTGPAKLRGGGGGRSQKTVNRLSASLSSSQPPPPTAGLLVCAERREWRRNFSEKEDRVARGKKFCLGRPVRQIRNLAPVRKSFKVNSGGLE